MSQTTQKICIVGGVAGGATAAARLRRLDETAQIIMFERSGFVSYANCGLPYYVGGVIADKDDLTLQTPESFGARFRVDVRVSSEVTSIDPVRKRLTVKRLADGSTYEESYEKLLLSPGAKAIRPPFPGADSARVFTLRTVEDTYRMRDFIDVHKPGHATIVGGGFIGLEMAENLLHMGISVTLLQLENQVLPPFDYDMACEIHAYLRSKGLDLRLNSTVEGFAHADSSAEKGDPASPIKVQIKNAESVCTDFVLLAIGVAPDTALAQDAGLALGAKGSILVNERMETSLPDIWAVGDAVEVCNFVTNAPALIPLAGPANKQGRIAADNICGRDSVYRGTQGSSILKLFELAAAATGLNEKAAQAAGLDYETVLTYSASHATYYPGANNLSMKTLFDRHTGRLLGAQIVGFDGVDKRIDVLATALRTGLTADDLAELELAYAPPFSSAKDPVNMAGFVAQNTLTGLVCQHHWHDVARLQADATVTLLDVRTPAEYMRGHIEGAINLPLDTLRDSLNAQPTMLDNTKPLYINCQSGLRSYLACRILTQRGFLCSNLAGGYRFYALVQQQQAFDAAPTHPCGLPIHTDSM